MSDAITRHKSASLPMRHLTVWLTRPLDQVTVIMPWLKAQGARVLHIPMMHIEPLSSDEQIRQTVLDLDRYDICIFISTNAAQIGMQYVFDHWPQYPAHLRNFAVGPATAEVLRSHHLEVDYPRERQSSEALLALPSLGDVRDKKILIFRGVGGRETLAEGLRARAAHVEYLELYRRAVPDYHQAYLDKCIRESAPDVIVTTSAEALENLARIFAFWPPLKRVRLLVSSTRLMEVAQSLGFAHVTEMAGAHDAAIQSAMDDVARETRHE